MNETSGNNIYWIRKMLAGTAVVALASVSSIPAHAQGVGVGQEVTSGSYEERLNPFSPPEQDQNRWFVNVDLAGVMLNESAKIYSPGPNVANSRISGASIKINSSYTITADVGYFITRDLAIDLYAGIPISATIQGKGTVGALGPLANTMYAPGILSLQYYYHGFGNFVPYFGVGVNRTFFRDTRHKALYGVKIADAWGTAFQVGAQYKLDKNWAVNIDARYIVLATHISAGLGPTPAAPRAFAKATANPAIVEAGVDYSF